jgi:DNA-binding MarR family transcriptional regulator
MTVRAEATRRPERKAARTPKRGPVFHMLRRAEQFAAETFLKSDLPDGTTLRQTVLLAAIAEADGASQSDLVNATGVDRSTLAEMMARMERKGFISRAAAEDDGRAKSVSITGEGRRRLEAALPAMREVDRALLAAIPANRRASFRATLVTLAKSADTQHASAGEAPRPAKAVPAKKPAMKKRKSVGKR